MADEDDGLETIATFPQRVDAVRECRSMMLAEWRTGMIPVYPIPEIILCAGPPALRRGVAHAMQVLLRRADQRSPQRA